MFQKTQSLPAALASGMFIGLFGLSGCQSQKTFSSPEAAVAALSEAVQEQDRGDLRQLFGSRAHELRSDDPDQDRNDLIIFSRRLKEQREISLEGEDRAVLLLGASRWPFAVPMVKTGGAWRFDTDAGIEELTNRRIGRNELQVIEACRTLIDAQREYISKDHDGDGVFEYASHLMSTEGTHDGLYWPAPGGVDPSPIGPVLAAAATRTDERGRRMPYYGYYFRPLFRGGTGDYMVNGNLTNGWGAVAYPAEYDVTGVMSFLCGSDGVVYQQDFGPETEKKVKALEVHDPSKGWSPVP
ncbi:MAG: DUF2950 domain-containing protein [Phycisphaerae bacterium]|nr:DUF2950 domain-containing protein [Phycisphaerae bacterium]